MNDFNEESSFNDDDVILPDDYYDMYSDDQPQSDEESQEPTPNLDEQGQPQPQNSQQVESIKVKYNHDEIDIPLTDAQTLIQKGLNYEKVHSKLSELEQDPRLTFVEELAQENGMDVQEFIESFQYERRQSQLDQLIQNNIPQELAEEILASREDRAERQRLQEMQQQEEVERQEYLGFFEEFRNLNGRDFDSNTDMQNIPPEVWQAYENGMPLRFAYLKHFTYELQNKTKQLQQNQLNEQRSPIGSTTSHGTKDLGSEDDFLAGFNSVH